MTTGEILTLLAIIIPVAMTLAGVVFTAAYAIKRTSEMIEEKRELDTKQDERIQALEIKGATLGAEVEGLASSVTTQLKTLVREIERLNRRLETMGK